MLSKRDVENILERVEEGEEWTFWRDSGTFNCWMSADGWVLQISHTNNQVAITNLRDGGWDTCAGEYTDDRQAIHLVTLAAADVERAYNYLRGKDTTTFSANHASSTSEPRGGD